MSLHFQEIRRSDEPEGKTGFGNIKPERQIFILSLVWPVIPPDFRYQVVLGRVYMELKTLPFSAPILVPYEVNRTKLELKKGLF